MSRVEPTYHSILTVEDDGLPAMPLFLSSAGGAIRRMHATAPGSVTRPGSSYQGREWRPRRALPYRLELSPRISPRDPWPAAWSRRWSQRHTPASRHSPRPGPPSFVPRGLRSDVIRNRLFAGLPSKTAAGQRICAAGPRTGVRGASPGAHRCLEAGYSVINPTPYR